MIKQKKKSLQKQLGEVHCEGYLLELENVYNFNYLGSDSQADGDHKHAAIVRMGLAKSVLGNMMKIWKSDQAQPAKLNLFGAAVVSVMTRGFESWCLDDSLLSTLRGWNARCLAHIIGNSISDECRNPTFDLIATLKCRRLKRRDKSWHCTNSKEKDRLREGLFLMQEECRLQVATRGGLCCVMPLLTKQ